MSFDYWWMTALISHQEYMRFAPMFEEANHRVKQTRAGIDAVKKWQYDPGLILGASEECLERQTQKFRNDFTTAFCIDAFEELWDSIVGDIYKPSNENVVKFIIYPNVPPVSILFVCLGPERAVHLPGQMGNYILSPEESYKMHGNLCQIYDKLDFDVAKKQVKNYLSYGACSFYEEDKVKEIIYVIPEALDAAKRKATGVLSIAVRMR